jgi:hypothetical protein
VTPALPGSIIPIRLPEVGGGRTVVVDGIAIAAAAAFATAKLAA